MKRGPTHHAHTTTVTSHKKMDANQVDSADHVSLKHLQTIDWKSIQITVTRLFQLRKLPDPELAAKLPVLNDKLSQLSHSEVGPFLGEFYQNHVLKKCMIILRQELVEEKGETLLKKLATVWSQFYTSILPTLQAIFAPVQLQKLSVKALTLISFRDTVLLKTDIAGALESHSDERDGKLPREIRQMLLVLQNVHRSPPKEAYFALQQLVGKVVKSYLPMVARSRTIIKAPSESAADDPVAGKVGRSETVAIDLGGPGDAESANRESSIKRSHSLTLRDIDKPQEQT